MSEMSAVPARWDDLLRKALLGSGRLGSGDVSAAASLMFAAPAESADHALLRSAALLAPLLRAGQIPVPSKSTFKIVAVSPEESLPQVNPDAELRLEGLVQEANMNLLAEWLTTAAQMRKRVPFRLLPALFEAYKTRNYNRASDSLCATIGTRGYWLAAQNPEWGFVLDHASEGSFPDAPSLQIPPEPERAIMWNTGTLRERMSLLRALRLSETSAAIELIQSTLATEELKSRREVVKALATGLAPGDEPFLAESLQKDRSEEVREAARELLLKLPNSVFSQTERERAIRLENRARAMIRIRKPLLGEIKVEIDPPAAFDPSMSADGVAEKVPAGYLGGPRAWWLEQIVANIDPKFWLYLSNATVWPEQLIKAIHKTDWPIPMLRGLTAATLKVKSSDWADALFEEYPSANMLEVMSKIAYDEALKQLLSQSVSGTPQESGAAVAILVGTETRWSVDVGRAALALIRQISAEHPKTQSTNQFLYAVGRIAFKIPASLAAEALEGWPENSQGWPSWKNSVEALLNTLQTRADMIREIKAP